MLKRKTANRLFSLSLEIKIRADFVDFVDFVDSRPSAKISWPSKPRACWKATLSYA
jgi:hypothetical protein